MQPTFAGRCAGGACCAALGRRVARAATGLGVIVETGGGETHGTRAAFQTGRRRDAALAAVGLRLVRFTWQDVAGEPGLVKGRLCALLGEVGSGPP